MSNVNTSTANKVLVELNEVQGNTFVSIRNYTNKVKKEGEIPEVSNQVIQIGVNRTKRLQKDLETLKAFDITEVADKFGQETADKAKLALIISLQKVLASEEEKKVLRAQGDKTIKRSDAQKDAYAVIHPKGMKYNYETKELYINGYKTFKEVIKEGYKKPVNSRALTLAKNKIKYDANLLDNNYRNFRIKEIGLLKINGEVINLDTVNV